MPRIVTGPLYAPDGGALANTDVVIAALTMGDRVLPEAKAVVRTDSGGSFSATLEDGRYSVSVKYRSGQGALVGVPVWIGNITVAPGTPISLLELLD